MVNLDGGERERWKAYEEDSEAREREMHMLGLRERRLLWFIKRLGCVDSVTYSALLAPGDR